MKSRIRTTLIVVLFLTALVIPVLAGQGPQIRVTHSATQADQPDVATDSNGNVHIAYSDSYNMDERAIWYTMLDNNGDTLIDDTRITASDDEKSTRPAIVVDSNDKVHILWRDSQWGDDSTQEVTYTKLDPYLDDMDGTAAISSTITSVDDTRLSNIESWYIFGIRVALDSNDDLHIVWDDDDNDNIYYMKVDSNGNELIAETAIRYAEQWRALPDVAVDSNGNPHIVWADYEDTSYDEIYYMMLDGSDGSTMIDVTQITADDGYDSKWTSIVVDADDKVHIIWQDKRAAAGSGDHEIYYAKLDPSLDDQSGDSANLPSIILVNETALTPDDGDKSRHPAVATDGRYIHVTWEEANNNNIRYMVLDNNGQVIIPNTPLTTNGTAYPPNYWTIPYLDMDANGTAHVVWCDSRDGNYEVYYSRYTHPIIKSVDNDAPIPGQRVTYTISIVNTLTNTTLTGAVVSDTLPAGLTFAGPVTLDPPQAGATLAGDAGDFPTLASGLTLTAAERITLTFPVTVNLGTEGQTISNTAVLTSTQVSTPNHWSAILTVPIVDLRLTKSAAFMAVPGEAFSYTIAFSNQGDVLVATNVVITDLVPVGQIDNLSYDNSGAVITITPGITYSWQVEDLSPGEGGVITITGIVDSGLATGFFISNTAVITTSDPDGDPGNNRNGTGAIVLIPNAWPTLLANTGLTLSIDAAVAITTANLEVTDAENGPDAVTYTLQAAPLYGDLWLNGVTTLTVGDTFTQTSIDQERLVYDHDGSPSKDDQFHFSASDSDVAPITRVSVDSAGAEADATSSLPTISADGRYIAFHSIASNLVVSDTNSSYDIFVHDSQTGQTIHVSVHTSGAEGNDSSFDPAISSDGRYVAFESRADNLVANDTNGYRDIFVHDVWTGQTTRVSIKSDGSEIQDANSYNPAISAGGRYVAFESDSADLIDGGNGSYQIFVHDRQTGQTSLVSMDLNGMPGAGDSESPNISAGGRYVVFESDAGNLIYGDSNQATDVFVHDRQTKQTTLVSVDSHGVQANTDSQDAAISAGGRYVVFSSHANNLVVSDTNKVEDIFVHDVQTGQTTRVSLDSNGEQAQNNGSDAPVISAGGRYVAFRSSAPNLTGGDTNSAPDTIVHDRHTGQTTRVSINAAGMQGDAASSTPAISADGRYVAFYSTATNLIDGDANAVDDIFVRDTHAMLDTFELRMLIPDLELTKAVDPIVAQPGDSITYTISFANTGLALATSVVISDAIPVSQVANLAYSSSGAAITPTGSTSYTWNVQDLAPGEGGIITITGVITPGLGPITFISNTAAITTGVLENNPRNNSSTADIFILVPAGWPTLVTNTGLSLPRGATAAITSTHLQVTDAENSPDTITYTVQITPLHGTLLLNGATTLLAGDTFTQTGIDLGRIEYEHDSSPTRDDDFLFTANDSIANRTARVSVSSAGAQATNGDSDNAAVSADGRYVAFVSQADNLVSGDSNNQNDIFVHDRQTGETTRVSVDSAGSQALGGDSSAPAISADGRYVAFASSAANLVVSDTNAAADVFYHDRYTGETIRISVDSDGNQALGSGSYAPALSANGRYVAFESSASNLVSNDMNTTNDIFVHDMLTGQTTRISTDSFGNEANNNSTDPSISADGRYVAFESFASNLVDDDNNSDYDIFVHDRVTGQTTRASINSDSSETNNDSNNPAISADGHYVVFYSYADNLSSSGSNSESDIFVHDLRTGQTTCVSLDPDGNEGDDDSYYPAISADGRYVAFDSIATNLVSNDNNGQSDVFVHDRQTGQTTRVSVDSINNQATGDNSNKPAISADGRYVAFDSDADNLVDSDTNSQRDIFVHDRGTVLDVFALRVIIPDVEIHKNAHFPFVEAGETLTYTISFSNVGSAIAADVVIVDTAPLTKVTNWAYTYTGATITPTGTITWSVQDLAPGEGGVITLTGVVSPGLAVNTFITNSAAISTTGHVEYDPDNNYGMATVMTIQLDKAPILATNTGRTVDAGATALITTTHLQVTDAENGPDLLTYTLQTAPTGGDLFRDTVPLLVGDIFTQTAIDDNRLAYVHDGSPGASDSFGFIANDTVISPTTRVSVDSAGGEGNNDSDNPSISASGRYVAFYSAANNLVISDTNSSNDVFVHDRQTGQTTRVSVDSAGGQVTNGSYHPAISADGRYVAFHSAASNLITGDSNNKYDIFVHDRQTGETTRVSLSSAGGQGNDNSYTAAISADGRYVAFRSYASNLVSGDSNDHADIFVHDRQTGETTRVSVDSAGVQGADGSFAPSLSADGRYVSFSSNSVNLIDDDTNGHSDIFVHDRQTGQTTRVSVDSAGVQANDYASHPIISADGRYVAFRSPAANLVVSDTNGYEDIFVHDRQTGQTTRVSIDTGGAQANDASTTPAISAGGRYVAFESIADNLVGSDTNNFNDVFIHDRQTGQTTRVSVDAAGNEGNNPAYDPAISASGRYVAFDSSASNLVGGDNNGVRDVFVRDNGLVQDVFDLIIDRPDVSLLKTVVPTQVLPGQPITYTLAFSNAGNLLATNVYISDTVPGDQVGDWGYDSSGVSITLIGHISNTWLIEIEDLSPGESGIITLTGIVTWPLASGITFSNTAAITCTLDGDLNNNDSDAVATILDAPPVAEDDSGATLEDTPLVLDVLANDHDDLNGDSLTLASASDGLSGTSAISGSLLVYTPTLDFYGSDSFTYTVEDSGGLSDVGLVNVTVTNTNDAPLAVDDGYVTAFDTILLVPVTDGVLDNDFDADSDPLTATLDSSPVGGLFFNPDGSFIYTPTMGFTGTDTFTYHAYDSSLANSNAATVTINVSDTVNTAPLAVDDSYVTAFEIILVVSVADGVLDNDFDADGDPLTATLDSSPVGTLAFDPDGSFIYTPTVGFTGTDSFSYHAYDSSLANSNVATVTINVSDTVNTAPVAVDDSYVTAFETTLNVSAADGVLDNDFDVDSDPLTATLDSSPVGTLAFATDGSFIYTPTVGFTGTDTFTYHAYDSSLANSNVATVTINVSDTVNTAPVAVDDSYVTAFETTLNVSAADGVLDNDFDTDGDPLTATLDSSPLGTLTLDPDGSFIYTPTVGFTGTDTFTYHAYDSSLANSNVATVTINVSDTVNNPPVAVDDDYDVIYETALDVPVADGVLDNDFDADGDLLTATLDSSPLGGLLFNLDGSFIYTPTTGFTGTDSFSYYAYDSSLANSNVATVTLNVSIIVVNYPVYLPLVLK